MIDIKEIVDEIEALKPIAPVAVQIMGMAEDPNRSIYALSEMNVWIIFF
jgi:hypothetical protein